MHIKNYIFILATCILLATCEKKETEPAWVGTWINEQTADFLETGVPIPVRTTLFLSKTDFEWVMSANILGQYIDVVIVKGELSATDKEFTISPKTLAMANEQGELQWISEGDPGWEEELAKWDMEETNSAFYELEGDTLILMLDSESLIFTRE